MWRSHILITSAKKKKWVKGDSLCSILLVGSEIQFLEGSCSTYKALPIPPKNGALFRCIILTFTLSDRRVLNLVTQDVNTEARTSSKWKVVLATEWNMFFLFSSPVLPIALWIYFTSLWERAHRKLSVQLKHGKWQDQPLLLPSTLLWKKKYQETAAGAAR